MKHIENHTTWDLIINVLEDLFASPEFRQELSDSESKPDNCDENDKIKKQCDRIAGIPDDDPNKGKNYELEKLEVKGTVFNTHIFIRMERHFYLQEIVTGEDHRKLRDFLVNIHAYIGNQYYVVNREKLREFLTCAVSFPMKYRNDHKHDKQFLRIGESAQFLKGYQIPLTVEYGTVSYPDLVEEELFCLLDSKTREAGGYALLNVLYQRMIVDQFFFFDLYDFSRKLDQEVMEPLNLLLNLAVKYLDPKVKAMPEAKRTDLIDEIIKIAESWLHIKDIQAESGIEYAMISPNQFPLYFYNEILVDKFCVPRQYSREYILTVLDYLVRPWFERAGTEYSYGDYVRVAEYIMDLRPGSVIGDTRAAAKKTKVSNRRIQMILKDISLKRQEVNRDFTSLEGSVNFYQWPLIELSPGRYLYVDYHFCGNGFYLAACDMIKRKFPVLDKLQGPEVEKILRGELEKKGYPFWHGDYDNVNQLGQSDCDAVMKGKRLFFFEVKKRNIADELDGLDDVAAFRQLSFGMVNAQKQCFFHERYLQKNGTMELKHKDGTSDHLVYDADLMPSYKISVCLPEYSFLTDKMFCKNVMSTIVMGGLSAVDVKRQPMLDPLNELGEKIANCANDIYAGQSYNVDDVSFWSLFCSMQQILIALWNSKTVDEFLLIVRDWMYHSDKTLNPYYSMVQTMYDYGHPEKLSVRKSAIDMLERTRKTASWGGY